MPFCIFITLSVWCIFHLSILSTKLLVLLFEKIVPFSHLRKSFSLVFSDRLVVSDNNIE